MMLIRDIVKFAAILIIFPALIAAEDNPYPARSDIPGRLGTKEHAIDKALQYTGFEKITGFAKTRQIAKAEQTVINSDNTPFLHGKINGRSIWRIDIEDISIIHDNSHIDTDTAMPRKYEIYINPDNGRLFKIFSPYEGENRDYLPEPPWNIAETMMASEVYLDFAPDSQYISLFEILKSGMRPSRFKEMNAQLLCIKRANMEPTMVWSITFRGIPPFIAKGWGGDNVPENARNYSRYAYDAKTGKLLYVTTIPPAIPPQNQDEGKTE